MEVFSGDVHGSGQTSRVGSGRVGAGQLTRPDPILRYLDVTRSDPRDFETS